MTPPDSKDPSVSAATNRASFRVPVWPVRLTELAEALRTASGRTAREPLMTSLWLLLTSAIDQYVCRYRASVGPIDLEDRQDLVAEKALDLLARLDQGVWEPSRESPGRVASFVARVARNGLVDHLRKLGPLIQEEFDPRVADHDGSLPSVVSPDVGVEVQAFVEALTKCVEELKPKPRSIWFLRTFYEMRSKQIATHPEVQLSVQNVDVVLLRTRKRIRACMKSRGFAVDHIPLGTFEVLWNRFRCAGIVEHGEA